LWRVFTASCVVVMRFSVDADDCNYRVKLKAIKLTENR
jgi:hypothetical protein